MECTSHGEYCRTLALEPDPHFLCTELIANANEEPEHQPPISEDTHSRGHFRKVDVTSQYLPQRSTYTKKVSVRHFVQLLEQLERCREWIRAVSGGA